MGKTPRATFRKAASSFSVDSEDLCKTHQVGLGRVLVFRAVVRCSFAEAVFGGCPRRLSVLSVGGALRSPAEQTDGFPNTSLDVNFCTEKERWHENMKL